MSKSKKNVVDPDTIIKNYGADALRLFVVSDTPPDRDFLWSDEGLEGCRRFINRMQRLFVYVKSCGICAEKCKISPNIDRCDSDIQKLYKDFHKTIKNVTDSLEEKSVNKVVAYIRDCVNSVYLLLEKAETNQEIFSIIIRDLIKLSAPVIPHICEEAWNMLGFEKTVCDNSWPDYNKEYIEVSVINLPVQVNGKLRGTINININADENAVLDLALQLLPVQNAIDGKPLKKKIFVKGKVLNLVV
jgi:leucyl-tRNA synthetase